MRTLIHSAPNEKLDPKVLQKLADFYGHPRWVIVGKGSLPKVSETRKNDLCVTHENYSIDIQKEATFNISKVLAWDIACLSLHGLYIGNVDDVPIAKHPATSTGAQREKLHALPYDLVPFQEMTEAYARVAEFGARKYDAWNWSKGLSRVQILGSLLRHTFAYLRGEERDKDSGLLHTDHILWNAVTLVHNVHWGLEDGRRVEPPREYKEKPLP